ncbi:hypothetical protein ES708_11481 [subsurface metagenome]
MTSDSVSAKLDAVLDPLAAIQAQVEAALFLAQQYKLPGPFIQTIKAAVTRLDDTWDELNEIATALDPDRAIPEL